MPDALKIQALSFILYRDLHSTKIACIQSLVNVFPTYIYIYKNEMANGVHVLNRLYSSYKYFLLSIACFCFFLEYDLSISEKWKALYEY